MSNQINMFWYKHSGGNGNFGDELNPYIVERLSGQDVRYVNIYYFSLNPFTFLKSLKHSLLTKRIIFSELFRYLYYYFIRKPKVIVAIGSVLQFVQNSSCIIWGAGIIKKNTTFSNADFRAVRGNETVKKLIELGYSAPSVTGDPALLLPLVYKPSFKKKYKIGIIPHLAHYESLKYWEKLDTIVINLLDPVEKIIDEICSCEITLSTSLHGIIVSHAYDIPSLWVNFNEVVTKSIGGDDIKFEDYFSSVSINSYSSVHIQQNSLDIDQLSEKYNEYLLPKKDILDLQRNLLNVAPFSVKKEFLNL